MRIAIYLLLGCALLGMGCEKPLTREEALPMIKSEFSSSEKFQNKIFTKLLKRYYNGQSNQCSGVTLCMQPFLDSYSENYQYVDQSEKNVLEQLKQKGYIRIIDSTDNSSCCLNFYVNIKLTEKAKKLLSNESLTKYYQLEILSKEVGNVTGIKETEKGKKAEVDFSVIGHYNDLANILRPNQNQISEETYTAIFEKYDDGWRITSTQKH